MSQLTDIFGDIADAIRGKNGSSDTYTPAQMAGAIDDIPSGGGGGTSIAHAVKMTKKEYENAHISSFNYPAKAYGCFSPFTSSEIDDLAAFCKSEVPSIFRSDSEAAMYIYSEDSDYYYITAISIASGQSSLYLSEGAYTENSELSKYNNHTTMSLHGRLYGAFLKFNKSTRAITLNSTNYGSYDADITLPEHLYTGLANIGYFFYTSAAFNLAPNYGVSFLTEYQYNYESEVTNTHASDTLYFVTDDSRKDIILYSAQGDTKIPSKYRNDISDYEFWYEDVDIVDYITDTDISFTGDNANRDFQFEFNLGPRGQSGEGVLIGGTTDSKEIYYDSSGNPNLKSYGGLLGSDDTIVSNFAGKDIVIKRESGAISITADGTETFTSNTWNLTGYLRLFGYYNNSYKYSGHINYFGFKWLD